MKSGLAPIMMPTRAPFTTPAAASPLAICRTRSACAANLNESPFEQKRRLCAAFAGLSEQMIGEISHPPLHRIVSRHARPSAQRVVKQKVESLSSFLIHAELFAVLASLGIAEMVAAAGAVS